MLETLLLQGGSASIRDIAAAILAHDESQLDPQWTHREPARLGVGPLQIGRDDRIRTCDPLTPSQGLTYFTSFHQRQKLPHFPLHISI
jgi:hypothetical protein